MYIDHGKTATYYKRLRSAQLIPVAKDNVEILKRIDFLKRYELTYYSGEDLNENGEYPYYEDPFAKENIHHFIIKVDGHLAGIVSVERVYDEEPHTQLLDLFLLLKFQDEGIEKVVAHQLFDMYPGIWKVFQYPMNNKVAERILKELLVKYVGYNYTNEVVPECDFISYTFHTDDHEAVKNDRDRNK